MKFALIHDDGRVFVAFEEKESVELLSKYFHKTGSMKEAVKLIKFDLKKKTLYK